MMRMTYKELKFYLLVHLDKENYLFRQRSLKIIDRAEDILLSRDSKDLNEFAEIIQELIKLNDNPEMLHALRFLTSPYILNSRKSYSTDNF